jgi:hypothetical protein
MPSSGASWRTRGRLLAVPLDKEEPVSRQRVEKVGFELIATTNRAQNAPKLAFSYPI